MSIRIIKPGVLDTVQDAGRYGYQQIGINPGGAADGVALCIANMLPGNKPDEAVVELHYPAASILFEQDALIALSGAEFGATINGQPVANNTPVAVAANSMLEFAKPVKGFRCYLAIKGGLQADEWLGSYSTNIKAVAGGYNGRKLVTGDVLHFKQQINLSKLLNQKSFTPFGWKVLFPATFPKQPVLRVCKGNEFVYLTDASKTLFAESNFTVTNDADRIGCCLSGIPLQQKTRINLISSGVTKGTIQLLPTGQLIILSADHQTTGGYPRVAHVISADMHLVAQLQPLNSVRFTCIDMQEAENLLLAQHEYLLQLQIACNLRLQEFLSSHDIH